MDTFLEKCLQPIFYLIHILNKLNDPGGHKKEQKKPSPGHKSFLGLSGGMASHTCNPHTVEAMAGRQPQASGQPGPQIVTLSLFKKKEKKREKAFLVSQLSFCEGERNKTW